MSFGFGSLAVGISAAINNISSNKRAFSEMSSNDAGPSHSPNIDIHGSTAKLALTLTSGETGKSGADYVFESRSGSDNVDGNGSGDDQDDNQPLRKKAYHRHSPKKIQEMEAFFKQFPHPDEKQRQHLSRRLNLEPRQIKFWFQNRRTQLKTQQERHENAALRDENEKLRRENMSIKEAMRNPTCCNCGGSAMLMDMPVEEQQLRHENARLKDELQRVSAITGKLCGRTFPQMASHFPMHNASLGRTAVSAEVNILDSLHSSTNLTSDYLHGLSGVDVATPSGSLSRIGIDKFSARKLALKSMDELWEMAHKEQPLWIPTPHDGIKEALNYEVYYRKFTECLSPKPIGYKSEANRHAGTVIMNSLNLVETFMDANRCAEMFPSIISRATTVDILFRGSNGTRNGELQLMNMELHVLSPLVPTREVYFLRFCKQTDAGVWAVIDFSIESLMENPPPSLMKCRRRPSGCIIKPMPNNCSEVIWVEHTDFYDTGVPTVYQSLVNCGMAFGSQRWLSTLQRQCEQLALLMNINANPTGLLELSLLKLAQQMTKAFYSAVSASNINNWSTLNEDIRVATRKSIEILGEPSRVVLSAATSVWLPIPREKLFDFLRNERHRSQWDMLSGGEPMQEIVRIAKGHHGNSVSLLRTNTMSSDQTAFVLQECCTDASGSLFVYGPVDCADMHSVFNGGASDYVKVLPSGFVIVPDGSGTLAETGSSSNCMVKGGSILTVAFQILLDTTQNLPLENVTVVQQLISSTVEKIKSAFLGEEP